MSDTAGSDPPAHAHGIPAAFTNDANGVMAWLDTARRVLNPSGLVCRRVPVEELHAFLRAVPPPPPYLQAHWRRAVWPLKNEPSNVYLVRCLAHHSSVTGVALQMSLKGLEESSPSSGQVPAAAAHNQPSPLRCETCVVAALRSRPHYAELTQTGWSAQPCQGCRGLTSGGASPAPSCTGPMLPLRYGGTHCPRCGLAFPLSPAWTRRRSLVLTRPGGAQVAAVALGDGLGPHLTLGARRRLLHYGTTAEGGGPLLVIVAAGPPIDRVGRRLSRPHPPLAAASLASLCRGLCPAVVGQECCQGLLLLSVVHTLYRLTRAAARPRRLWPPLHLLLVGPAKAGKSTLLRAVARVYGVHAVVVGSTAVQHRGAAQAGAVPTLEAALPGPMGGLLLAGAATASAALVVDDLGSSCSPAVLLPIEELLTRGGVCLGAGSGVTTAFAPLSEGMPLCGNGALSTSVQLMAGVHSESTLARRLGPQFPLVASVSPRLSLRDSATIGHSVVAASVARSSASCSGLRAATRSRTSTSSSDGRSVGDAAAPLPLGAFGLSAETLIAALYAAPAAASLEACVASGPYMGIYVEQLTRHAGLLEAAAVPRETALPAPAALRGRDDGRGWGEGSDRCGDLTDHLRTLAALTYARLALAGGVHHMDEAAMAAEVWSVYKHHLCSVAEVLDTARSPAAAPTPGPPQDIASMLLAAAGRGARRPVKRRCSTKRAKLLLADLMLREQERLSTGPGAEAVCPFNRAEVLYASLGARDAMGDPLDMVLAQLQHEGLLIRRHNGWRVTGL